MVRVTPRRLGFRPGQSSALRPRRGGYSRITAPPRPPDPRGLRWAGDATRSGGTAPSGSWRRSRDEGPAGDRRTDQETVERRVGRRGRMALPRQACRPDGAAAHRRQARRSTVAVGGVGRCACRHARGIRRPRGILVSRACESRAVGCGHRVERRTGSGVRPRGLRSGPGTGPWARQAAFVSPSAAIAA